MIVSVGDQIEDVLKRHAQATSSDAGEKAIAALEQVAGSLGLDLEKFVKRVAGQDGANDNASKRGKAGDPDK